MFYQEETTIKEMIVHILDPFMMTPIFSHQIIESSPHALDFFLPHIIKLLNDDQIKSCRFSEEQNMFLGYIKDYQSEKTDLITTSVNIGEKLFAIMQNNPDIPAADLAVIRFLNKSVPYLALLKLNYQKSYIHDSDYEAEQLCNHILEYRTSLPSPSQRINEGVVINLHDLSIQVVEKSYLVDGLKQPYLSNILLKCATGLSSKEQLNIVKQTTNQISKKYFNDDPEKKITLNKELYEAIGEDGMIQLDTYANKVFRHTPEVKEQFMETMEKKGLDKPTVTLQEKTIAKAFTKQKIRTDEGVEITIPMAFYNDPSKMEILTDSTGRITITIKDVNKIM
ncbi:MAG: nucleoid-associated protein [Vallitaleaceae bacterium]|nr:nucleoid-associated protein [Vallitaleaceae bacterium]